MSHPDYVNFSTIDHLWDHCMKMIKDAPKQESRNGITKEVLGFHGVIHDIWSNILMNSGRNMDPVYAAAEFLWYMAGDNKWIVDYAPQYEQFMDNGIAHGAYGPRMNLLISELIGLLKRDSDTRRAILQIYCADDLRAPYKDIPCTIMLQYLIRDGELNCICYMRSNDIWLGMPYDIFCFTMLQMCIADHLNLDYGFYQHIVGSLHLYEKDFDKKSVYQMSEGIAISGEKDIFNQIGIAVPLERHVALNNDDFTVHVDLNTRFKALLELVAYNWTNKHSITNLQLQERANDHYRRARSRRENDSSKTIV